MSHDANRYSQADKRGEEQGGQEHAERSGKELGEPIIRGSHLRFSHAGGEQ